MRAIFLLLITLLLSAPLFAEVPAEIAIGVPQFNEGGNLLTDQSRAYGLLRSALTDTVLNIRKDSNSKQSPSTLVLADSFQVDANLLNWSYRLRQSLVFSNGQPIRASDVCYSISQCTGKDSSDLLFESCVVRDVPASGLQKEWVDIRFASRAELVQRQTLVTQYLADCPIFERRTRQVFGDDFANDANFVGSGEYRLVGFNPGKDFRLERFQRDTMARAVPNQIVDVRTFRNSSDALAALRVGTIVMFYDPDPETIAVAKSDETLRVGECDQVPLVYRRGVEFECQGQVRLSSIIWNLP